MRQHLRGGAGGQVGPGDEDQAEDVRTEIWYEVSVRGAEVDWSHFIYEIYIYNVFRAVFYNIKFCLKGSEIQFASYYSVHLVCIQI